MFRILAANFYVMGLVKEFGEYNVKIDSYTSITGNECYIIEVYYKINYIANVPINRTVITGELTDEKIKKFINQIENGCKGCFDEKGQNIGNMHICPTCGRSVN